MTESTTCPVCSMEVEDVASAPSSTFNGKTYRFCCDACKQLFDSDPERYVGA